MELTAVLTPAEEGREATVLYLSEFPLPVGGHPVVTVFTVPTPGHA